MSKSSKESRTKSATCVGCQSDSLHFIYSPAGTKRNSKVFDCHVCGLIQSKSNIKKRKRRSLSSDADWGNVRHAKPLRIESNNKILTEVLHSLPPSPTILDIGASRGHFYSFLKNNLFNFLYEGVESDNTLPKFSVNNGMLHYRKFEDIQESLLSKKYDLIFLNHTLEHVDEPRKLLQACMNLMDDSSLLWIDVPNTTQINDKYIVEEYFIDKHTVHFSKESLNKLLNMLGYRVVKDFSDNFNLVLLCKVDDSFESRFTNEAKCVEKLIKDYSKNLINNRKALKDIAEAIESLENGLIIFGGGRLLEAIVRYGGFNVENVKICDSYLSKYAENLGYKIYSPDQISWSEVTKVLILARSSKIAIAEYVKQKCSAEILYFEELLRKYSDSLK